MANSQKFIARNRAPRVQIEYDVEVYGAQKKVQLPFVMGVMSDLSGQSAVVQPSVADRKFLEIDIDNFDERMRAMQPRVQFAVPNTMTGEGNLAVDIAFERMEDFSPAAIARKVEPLRKLLEARAHLNNLLTYMDGKSGAEALLDALVGNPDQLRALLAGGAAESAAQDAVLGAVAAGAPQDAAAADVTGDVLANIAATAPDDAPRSDTSASVLADMAATAPAARVVDDGSADILSAMASTAPEAMAEVDGSAALLAEMVAIVPEGEPEDDGTDELLADMAADAPDDDADADGSDQLLADMAADAPEDEPEVDGTGQLLAGIAADAPEDAPEDDGSDELLADMAAEVPDDEPDEDNAEEVLADMAADAPEDEPEVDGTGDLLAGMAADAPEVEFELDDETGGLLAGMAADAPEDEPEDDGSDALFAGMVADADDSVEEDAGPDSLLAEIAGDLPVDDEVDESTDALLSELSDSDLADAPHDTTDDLLAALADDSVEDVDEADDAGDLLADMAAVLPKDDDIDTSAADADLAALLGDDADGGDIAHTDPLAALMAFADQDDADGGDFALDDLLGDDDDGLAALLADNDDDPGDDPGDDDESDPDALIEDDYQELGGDLPDDDDDLPDVDALLADGNEAGLDALLGDEDADDTDLETLLGDTGDDDDDDNNLDDLLGDDDLDLDALLADDEADADLDALLGADDDGDEADEDDIDLDALLADSEDDDDLDSLLGDDDTDLDALLGDDDDAPEAEEKKVTKPKDGFQPNFGTMGAPALTHEAGARRKFRIAVLGDFSGRANRGDLQTGADLASRKAFKLDFDTLDTVISRFRTTLTLPVGSDGAAMEIELGELDDLHPDELFDTMDVFSELSSIRRSLTSGKNLDSAIRQLEGWGVEFGDYKLKSPKRGKGGAAPADMKLSDFQSLIGDTAPRAEASDASDIIARIVGPYITATPQKGTDAMIAAVDKALSGLMSAILHHPDFQTLESAWRAIDLLGRRVESGTNLEVVVYDMAAEEFAADLAGAEDMAETGLFDMLVERPRADESQGPLSAIVGLYTWEETPPHAEILARMARISAYMDAPFISSISTAFMGVKPEDRHPLVQKTWGALRGMSEARYLGLATPRFMLRMPYGKKSDPIERFDYEEFNTKDGVRTFLMANPALLVAVLLAETVSQQGKNISLGSIMTLDDIPFYYMKDQYGDQVALPCTERLLNVRSSAEVVARGYMPVLSIQGQNVVRLGSFQAVGGGELAGIWSGESAGELGAGRIQARTSVGIGSAVPKAAGGGTKAAARSTGGGDDDDLNSEFEADDDDDGLDLDLDFGDDDDADSGDLDDLLAGFGDDSDDDGDDDDMDAELAALLGDL